MGCESQTGSPTIKMNYLINGSKQTWPYSWFILLLYRSEKEMNRGEKQDNTMCLLRDEAKTTKIMRFLLLEFFNLKDTGSLVGRSRNKVIPI